MGTLLRLTAAGLAASAVLAAAAVAAPALVVRTPQVVDRAGAVTVATQEGPGTYRTTILAPAAYRLPETGRLGRQLGTALVHVSTPAGPLAFHGFVVADDPASYVNDACAAFAGEDHAAVWLLALRQVDGLARASIPVFVDHGPSGQTELTWCASAAADMTVTGVSFTVRGAIRNPAAAGTYAWHARFDLLAAGRSTLGLEATAATAVVHVRNG